jgi:hypothetical protein
MSELTQDDIARMVHTLQTQEEWDEFMVANEINSEALHFHAGACTSAMMIKLGAEEVNLTTALAATWLAAFLTGWKCGQMKLAEDEFPGRWSWDV